MIQQIKTIIQQTEEL